MFVYSIIPRSLRARHHLHKRAHSVRACIFKAVSQYCLDVQRNHYATS